MAVRDLIPWGRNRSSVPSTYHSEEVSPFLTLHREMNRLFDDVFNRFEGGVPSLIGRGWPSGSWLSGSWPSLEVNASDKRSASRPNCPAWTTRMSRSSSTTVS